MKLFLSWSKPRSRLLALKLRQWLPDVIHRVEPWMSSEDISKGRLWMSELSAQLRGTTQACISVTRENYREPWLNFEAGALANAVDIGRVRPLLLDIPPSDLTGPLAQFQTTVASDVDDVLKLVESLNAECEEPLDRDRLERSFRRAWPELQKALQEIASLDRRSSPARSAEDKLDEILARLRRYDRMAVGDLGESTAYAASPPKLVRVDLSALGPSFGMVEKLVDASTTVSDFLDELYISGVSQVAEPYSYGEMWALATPDQTVLRDLGSYWAERRNEDRDDRPLTEAGVPLHTRLLVVRLPT